MTEKVEVEETVSRERFIQFLRELADAMEASSPFQMLVNEQLLTIPIEGKIKVELESEDEERELEVEVKWASAA